MNIKCIVFLISIGSLYGQDLDSMWNSAVWTEIVDIPKTTIYEVEYVTAAAGVRGAEAEDEALKYLWYRKKAIRDDDTI